MRRFSGFLADGGEERLFRSLVGQWDEPGKLVHGAREPVDDIWQGALGKSVPDFGRRMQLIDTLTYLPDDILVKVDRASMAVGLEARTLRSITPSSSSPGGCRSCFSPARARPRLLRQVLDTPTCRAPPIERPEDGLRHAAWTNGCEARSKIGRRTLERAHGRRRPA
jgi:hypothetical protein